MKDEAPKIAVNRQSAARAAVVAFWLANVPVGMWVGRGYYLASRTARMPPAARGLSLWLLAVVVAVWLLPGLLGALGLVAVRWRRAAGAWLAVYCAAAHAVLLVDGTLYSLLRIHVTDGLAMAVLREPGALAAIGVSAGTVWLGTAILLCVALLEAGGLAAAWQAARRTRGFERLRAAVRRIPYPVRYGLVAALVLPVAAVAAVSPRGPMLDVPRHFVVPLAPPARSRSKLLAEVNDALRVVAYLRRPPPEGTPLPIPAATPPAPLLQPPSILFLCLESLRCDAVTPDTMPRLAALERECVVARSHYVEGNITHHSLFAAIAGLHPMWYGQARLQRPTPAPLPLRLLEANGYALHAIAASRLDWVGMADTVFPRELFDTYEELGGRPGSTDPLVVERLLAVAREAEGPFFAFGMLDATHFNYYYPPGEERFRPAAPPTIRALTADELQGHRTELWNRYRNSARYLDRVVGDLVDGLRRESLLDRLILVVASDHGESFLEDGVIAHGNSFHDVQVMAPVLIRYPGGRSREVTGLTQNADLFPSLFAEMGLAPEAIGLPGFRTLRREPDEERPWAVCAMATPHTPVSYLLVTDALRTTFQFAPEASGEVLLEATEITARSGGVVPPGAARRVVESVAAWLDRQGFVGTAPARR